MQPHRLRHLRPEPGAQEFVAALLMQVVDPCFGRVLAEIVHHMADIVQQAGDDQRLGAALPLGQPAGLQRVLLLVDVGQAVLALRLQGQQIGDALQPGIGHRAVIRLGYAADAIRATRERQTRMARRRNVLLIIADQWRGDCLGVLGHPGGAHAEPRRAGATRRDLHAAFRPERALRPGPRLDAHRPLRHEPPGGGERRAAGCAPSEPGAGTSRRRARPQPGRLHHHHPRPALDHRAGHALRRMGRRAGRLARRRAFRRGGMAQLLRLGPRQGGRPAGGPDGTDGAGGPARAERGAGAHPGACLRHRLVGGEDHRLPAQHPAGAALGAALRLLPPAPALRRPGPLACRGGRGAAGRRLRGPGGGGGAAPADGALARAPEAVQLLPGRRRHGAAAGRRRNWN